MKKQNKQTPEKTKKYAFIGKTLFFPSEKILVIGDLHLGFEKMLRKNGLDFPIKQFEGIKEEIERTIRHIKARYGKIERIVLLGDIRHHYSFEAEEKNEVNKLIAFLKNYVEEKNIVFIRGNHEKNHKSQRYIDYYIVKDILFVHGDRDFIEIYDPKIKSVVMGHLHPSITLRDEMNIRNEKYKCFLVGEYRSKNFIVVPSFLTLTEGVTANEIEEIGDNFFSIIPNKKLDNFEVFVCQNIGEEPLGFGRLRNL